MASQPSQQSPMRFAHMPHVAPSHSVHRVPSNLDEGFSEETQSQPGSDTDMEGQAKIAGDGTGDLVRDVEALSLSERMDVLRQVAGGLTAEDQLGG